MAGRVTPASRRTLKRAVSDEDKQQRRAEILGAARRLFAERGYHETTIADVARGTGLSYGVVYWYFSSKDELFHALMSEEEEQLRSRIQAALRSNAGAGDEVETLRFAVRATFAFFAEDPASAQLVFQGPRALGEPFERHLFGIFERFIDDLEGLVVRAQAKGLVQPGSSRMVAATCAGLIAQLALRRIRTDDGLSPEEAADFVVGVLFDGLRPRPAPARNGTRRSARATAVTTTAPTRTRATVRGTRR
jgi:AcrR family transcriptional regulator